MMIIGVYSRQARTLDDMSCWSDRGPNEYLGPNNTAAIIRINSVRTQVTERTENTGEETGEKSLVIA